MVFATAGFWDNLYPNGLRWLGSNRLNINHEYKKINYINGIVSHTLLSDVPIFSQDYKALHKVLRKY